MLSNKTYYLFRHGTRCAGEVAAQSNNSICAVGIAFDANIGGILINRASDHKPFFIFHFLLFRSQNAGW